MNKRMKTMVVIVTLILVVLTIALNKPSEVKQNRKVREKFKENLLSYKTDVDFTTVNLTADVTTFFDIDISAVLEENELYFDNKIDFVEDYLKESLYDYEEGII